ncbi:MAG: aspartate aminotransferase family protein [Candidatus Omnitrophica bacterium]|nr:aspartate aminotransferase family protein [Candidatus Omnitrophota bacterium]
METTGFMKEDVLKNYDNYVIGCYRRSGIIFVKGKGSYLWDIDGKKYLDFFPGWAVSGLGHCHPAVVEAIKKQAEELIHIANNHYHPWQGLLAKKLSEISFGGKVFFCNSGAEANESAIKLTRLYGRKKGRYKIISMENSFHGRTLATVTMTGQSQYSKPFEPLPAGFSSVPFNNFDKLVSAVDEQTAGIIIEPVQGEGGINVANREYLVKVRDLCNKKDILLIFDEVQTGFGKTGKFFAYQYFGITPDIITLAKTLGGGFPIGAMIAKKEVAELMVPGTHASTFGGSPLACASSLAVIETIEKECLLENVNAMGNYLFEKLTSIKKKYLEIKKIKGLGLMLGMEMEREANWLVHLCAENGLLINCTQGNIIRIMPAITVNKEEIDEGIEVIDRCLGAKNEKGLSERDRTDRR